jgi:hypothetical protein
VAPVFGFKTGKIVGVETKPLPSKPGEKTEGRNHGPTGQGAFMFGTFDPKTTKRVILTEGFIKAIAFLQIHRESMRIGEETCIMSRAGAKPTLEIIPKLKEIGAEAVVAFDNDFTGRSKAQKFDAGCKEQGVPCQMLFVEPAEVTVSISQTPYPGHHDLTRAQTIEQDIIKFASSQGITWAFEREHNVEGFRSIRLPNTQEVIEHIEEHLNADRKLSGRDYQARAKLVPEAQRARLAKNRWVKLETHNKDWDDMLKKGPYVPRAPQWQVPAPIEQAPPVPAPAPAPVAPPRGGSGKAPSQATPTQARVTPAVPNPAPAPATKSPAQHIAIVAPPLKAILVSRQTPGHDRTIYSVGTADTLFDISLTPEQVAHAAGLLSEETPRDALVSAGPQPTLAGIMNIDGLMVDAVTAGLDVGLVPAPDAVQRAWRKPKTPSIVEAVMRLRRENGLPVPTPTPAPAHALAQE